MRIIATIMLFACMAFIPMNAATLADKEVTLTVSSDGASKEEAIRNALRSAIEQTYGTFVSSNTTLVNDELIKDEIVTVSTGNIKKYKELFTETLPNGRVFVTLQATISISKLVSYAKSKGAKVEFDGASLAMNLELERLNTKNQEEVLVNLVTQVLPLFKQGNDYTLKVLDIDHSIQKEGIQISFEIKASVNENFKKGLSLIYQTLQSLHVPEKQQKKMTDYVEIDIEEYYWHKFWQWIDCKERKYIIRTSENTITCLANLSSLMRNGVDEFVVEDSKGIHGLFLPPDYKKDEYGKYYKEEHEYGKYYSYGMSRSKLEYKQPTYQIKYPTNIFKIRTEDIINEMYLILDSESKLNEYTNFTIRHNYK